MIREESCDTCASRKVCYLLRKYLKDIKRPKPKSEICTHYILDGEVVY